MEIHTGFSKNQLKNDLNCDVVNQRDLHEWLNRLACKQYTCDCLTCIKGAPDIPDNRNETGTTLNNYHWHIETGYGIIEFDGIGGCCQKLWQMLTDPRRSVLTKYKKIWKEKVQISQIVLVKDLKVDGLNWPATSLIELGLKRSENQLLPDCHRPTLLIDGSLSTDMDYYRHLIHHEIFHCIEYAVWSDWELTELDRWWLRLSEGGMNSCNDKEGKWRYLDSGRVNEYYEESKNPMFLTEQNSSIDPAKGGKQMIQLAKQEHKMAIVCDKNRFVTKYAQSSPIEDRAECFAILMSSIIPSDKDISCDLSHLNLMKSFNSSNESPILQAKLQLTQAFIQLMIYNK